MNKIPLSIPNLCGNERKYINECINTNFVSSVGPFVSRFEDEFAKYLGVKRAVAVVNGTAALHLALILSDIEMGDEVLVPNLTFVAPLNAVKYVGANPILVDSNWETLGMDPKKLEEFLESNSEMVDGFAINKTTGNKIKAVIPMHTLGICIKMDELLAVTSKYNLRVIEDSSESLGAVYRGKHTGTMGDFGCFSFNGNKIITTGGGGMLVTNNERLADKAKHLSTTAKTNGLHFVHDEVGYNYRMVNILAALGVAQLEMLDSFLNIKRGNFYKYKEKIDKIEGLQLHSPTNDKISNFWFYSVVVEDEFPLTREELLQHLLNNGVDARPIWTLMEDLKMYKGSVKTNQHVSRDIYKKIINIPCSTNLTCDELNKVCDVLEGVKR